MAVLTISGDINKSITDIQSQIALLMADYQHLSTPNSPVEMLEAEKAHRIAGGELANLMTVIDILHAHADDDFIHNAVYNSRIKLLEDSGVKYIKNVGWCPTSIKLAHGLELRLNTPYLRPTTKGLPGRPRGVGRRRRGGAGCYPVLEQLGIIDKVTPLTRSDIGRQLVLSSSYAEAIEQLSRHGLVLNKDTLVKVAVATGLRALVLREHALEAAKEQELPDISVYAGRRLRVSVDGGRVRIRHTKTNSKKGKNGRRPFELVWREPRIITLDVLDDEGKTDRDWRPIYEVTLAKADDVFALLTGLLRLIGAHQAKQVIFVADGALWMWDRLDQLIKDAEIPEERFHAVLDYYHATEHISDALKACKSIKPKERTKIVKELSELLLQPQGVELVIKRLSTYAKGRRAAEVNLHIRYLEKRIPQMRYAEFRAMKIPIGSGVVESAVRRILNLRFKSASMCWREDRLEPLLYLRAIIKAGWWDDAIVAWLEGDHWLKPVSPKEAIERGITA